MTHLTRRDALKKLAAGGAAAATAAFWGETLAAAAAQHASHYHEASAADVAWTPKVLSAPQNDTVVTLAEIIIPQTETPGATTAKVNRFIDAVLADAKPDDRHKFLDGLTWLDGHAVEAHAAPFISLTPDQQLAIVTSLAAATLPGSAVQPGTEFFTAMKSLTVTGYYTSEVAMREEIGDDGNMVFAEFKGCSHAEHQ
jgi:hypothetical protein